MQLIIAEKPQVGRAIAEAIAGSGVSKDGAIVKGDYTITWALGHLLDLKDPEDYDESLKSWSLGTLPIYFPDWGMKPNDTGDGSRKARLEAIGKLLKEAELVIHAGDPDDEGQYLIDEILRWFNYTGKTLRMDTNDTTKEALKKALNNLKDNKPLEKIGWSAHARRVSDKIVGYNCSRYFSLKNPGVLLTIGRVQTSALGLVVLRDLAIEGHKKIFYYEVFSELECEGKIVKVQYIPDKNDRNLSEGRILSRDYAEIKVSMIDYLTIEDVLVEKKQEMLQPPLPFNLTGLQTYCSVHFGYEPSKVLSITQSLRDRHNAITYNRSDCNYLSEEQYKEAPATMQQVLKNISYTPKELDISLHSKAFNDKLITAHTAIIPQNKAVDLTKLTDEERNVYLAICKYYIVQFLPCAVREVTSLTAPLPDGGSLSAKSVVFLNEGFKKLLKKEARDSEKEKTNEEQTALSEIAPGNYVGEANNSSITEKETRPPKRYTKASLAKDMTEIAKYVEDSNVKALLLAKDRDKKGENGSIGTVATRPQIIDKLEERGYIKANGKQIVSTELGRELYRILPDELKKPDMTAFWWSIQEDIKTGEKSWEKLTESVMDMVSHVIHTEYPSVNMQIIPSSLKRSSAGSSREVLGSCPRCGMPIVEGRSGFGCSGYRQGCKFVIWKTSKSPLFSKTAIKPTQVKTWLSSGWEDEIVENEDGSIKKSGNKISKKAVTIKTLYSQNKNMNFTAKVYLLDKNNPQYPSAAFKLDFSEVERPSLGKCPRCGGDVKEFSKGYSCFNKEAECRFVIWKKSKLNVFSQTAITASDVKNFLKGNAVKKEKLVTKSGNIVPGILVMEDDPSSQYGPNFKIAFEQDYKS